MPEYPILLTLQQAAKRSGKSEKTLRRWIKDGKLTTYHGDERKPGDPYMIFPKDLDAATGGDKTKEWQVEQEIADLRMRVVMLESMVEELQGAVRAQQYDIEDLQIQVKKLQPKKTTTRKHKTPTRRKRNPLDLFE
jgi:uncharacterized coiled-coil protein SlyX